MQNSKTFYDDLSVYTRKLFFNFNGSIFITIILFIGIVVSEVHLLYSMLIVLVGLILLRLFKSIYSLLKINIVSSYLYYRRCTINLWVR